MLFADASSPRRKVSGGFSCVVTWRSRDGGLSWSRLNVSGGFSCVGKGSYQQAKALKNNIFVDK
jgi:hypothetical protein